MKNVKWATAIYSAVSCGSVLIAMCGMYYGLKGDIKENGVTETMHYREMNHKVDSISNETKKDISGIKDVISDIWEFLNVKKIRGGSQSGGKPILVTGHRDEYGNVSFQPYRK